MQSTNPNSIINVIRADNQIYSSIPFSYEFVRTHSP